MGETGMVKAFWFVPCCNAKRSGMAGHMPQSVPCPDHSTGHGGGSVCHRDSVLWFGLYPLSDEKSGKARLRSGTATKLATHRYSLDWVEDNILEFTKCNLSKALGLEFAAHLGYAQKLMQDCLLTPAVPCLGVLSWPAEPKSQDHGGEGRSLRSVTW